MSNRHISASDLNTASNNQNRKEEKMALGKYAVDYEMRVDYDRLRKERLQRAKDQINKDGLGAIVTWDEANIRYMTSYYVTTPSVSLRHSLYFARETVNPISLVAEHIVRLSAVCLG
jgi:hypothetical protein